jgi:hypothetical protein
MAWQFSKKMVPKLVKGRKLMQLAGTDIAGASTIQFAELKCAGWPARVD